MLLVNDPGDWEHVFAPLEHAAWNGCMPTDLVFPFFLFVVGVSVALAILPRLEQGAASSALTRTALWRARVSCCWAWRSTCWRRGCCRMAHLRLPGVLQRIGMCFAGAGAVRDAMPGR